MRETTGVRTHRADRTGRLRRGIAGVAAAALAMSGASLALAAPANAAGEVYVTDIAPTEESYLGWHEGHYNPSPAYSLEWDGLHFGNGANSQILNGLVNTGEPGIEIAADALRDLIVDASVDITAGSVFLQVPVTFGDGGWSTLRPATGAGEGTAAYSAGQEWISTKSIGSLPANNRAELAEIILALETEGNVRYSGFGILTEQPSVVTELNWGGTSYIFEREVPPIPVTSETLVTAGDIRPDETVYAGWHEGYKNASPAYSVADNGLHLGIDGVNSQIIKGFQTPLTDPDLASLLTSSTVNVDDGSVYFQLPLTFGSGDTFATLRPADGASVGTGTYDLSQLWKTSKAIPATATTEAIAANAVVPLGDLITAIESHGNIKVLAFGVLADNFPSVVSSISWNGVSYNFGVRPAVATSSSIAVSPAGAAVYGTDVTITATVAPASAAGSFEILNGGSPLGEGRAVNGSFALTTSDLAIGSHSLTAVFTPDHAEDFTGSTSTAVTVTVNKKEQPAAPPAPSDSALDELIADQDLDVPGTTDSFVATGEAASNPLSSFDASKPLSGELPWSNSADSFVDVYIYSTPIFLGTFPVVDGEVVLTDVDLSALEAGGHRLVFVGQTSGETAVMAVTIAATPGTAASLPSTGADVTGLLVAVVLLLLGGVSAAVISRRHAKRDN